MFKFISKLFKNKEEITEIKEENPVFDKKYKIVLRHNYDETYYDKLKWIDENSNGLVDIKNSSFLGPKDISIPWYAPAGILRNNYIYFAFENEDDATFFKIKYGN